MNNYRIYELHIFKQHFLGRKETKKKIYATCKVRLHDEPLCSQNRSSLAKPNGTDSGTNIRHSLCNPPPLLLCSCSRDRSFRIDLLFCYVRDMAIPAVEFLNLERLLPENHWIFQIGVMGTREMSKSTKIWLSKSNF